MHKYESGRSVGGSEKSLDQPRNVAVVGARGYSGTELCRLLLAHPAARLAACFSDDASFGLTQCLPDHAGAARVPTLPMGALTDASLGLDLVFLATPAEASLELAPRVLAAGIHCIDLSGAFRLTGVTASETQALYRQWYGFEHTAAAALAQAEYGLVPWAGPVQAKAGPRLIANPGCYATSVLMALLPLARAGLIDPSSVVIDAKSGTTGAGRKAAENLLFSEVEGECLPYRVGRHQHLPEIAQYLGQWAGSKGEGFDPFFTTHLLSVRRGILSSLYARTVASVTLVEIAQAYDAVYSGYPLLRHGAFQGSKAQSSLVSLKRVAGTARTLIGYELSGDKLHVFSLIDNLLKGAASQAIENFNRIFDRPVSTGLIPQEENAS